MVGALITPGIHDVTVVASDARSCAVFYESALGLRPVWRHASSGAARVYGGPRGGPGTRVRILERREAGRGRPGIGGLHHLAFGTADDEALLRWKRRLTDLGIPVSGPYDRGYFTSIYFRDPDGQIVEIATEGPGYAIDEPADRLGGELMLPPQRIVRGHRDEHAIARLTHPEPVPEITGAMELKGIHHVSGITDDLERAGDFYASALGLRRVKRTTNRDDPRQLHHFWASYDGRDVAPHSAYTLFGWPSGWNRAVAGAGQARAVSFRARDADELPAWRDHLKSLSVEVSPVLARGGEQRLRFAAPDGMLLEIATDGSLSGTGAPDHESAEELR